jgi:phage recombination protein Bet
MNNVVALTQPTAVMTGAQLALVRRTVASDCNDVEFDLFMAVAQSKGLDPFTKQISAIVFNKDKPDKRKMAIITTIDGFRVIAERTGQYHPDDDEPEFSYDPDAKGPLNPLGLVKAKVKVFKDGRPAPGVAYWEEFAPIKDEWAENDQGKWKPTGRQTLDIGGNWGKMPRVMLAKCAEAQALRKAFPERLSGLYEGAEFDRQRASEVLPSELVAAEHRDQRLARIGGANGIMLQLFPNAPLELVPLGQVHDRAAERVSEIEDMKLLDWFVDANQAPLKEFWARAPGDALELKKVIERQRVLIKAQVPE